MAEEKQEGKDLKHLIRVGNTDIEGDQQILYGLTQIKGVDEMFANAMCRLAGIHTQEKAGAVSDELVEELNDIVENPVENGMPAWLVNRRKDIRTGEDKHLLGGDIDFVEDQDIKRMKKAKTYRGMRHTYGLTVRGQRTRGNFRSSSGTSLGVQKQQVKSDEDES